MIAERTSALFTAGALVPDRRSPGLLLWTGRLVPSVESWLTSYGFSYRVSVSVASVVMTAWNATHRNMPSMLKCGLRRLVSLNSTGSVLDAGDVACG